MTKPISSDLSAGIEIYIDDGQVTAGMAKAEQKVKAGASKMAAETGKIINPQTQKSMKRFDGDAQKISQAMNAAGMATGFAGGEVMKYTGLASALIGIMNPWVMVITAAGAALGVLLSVMKSANRDMELFNAQINAQRKSLQEYNASIRQMYQSQMDQVNRLTEWDKKLREINRQINTSKMMIEAYSARMAELVEKLSGLNVGSIEFITTASKLEDAHQKLRAQKSLLTQQTIASAGATKLSTDANKTALDVEIKAIEATRRREMREERFQRRIEARKAALAAAAKASEDAQKQEAEAEAIWAASSREWREQEITDDQNLGQIKIENQLALDEQRRRIEMQFTGFLIEQEEARYQASYDAEQDALEMRKQKLYEQIEIAGTFVSAFGQAADMFDLFGEQSAQTAEEQARAEARKIFIMSIINAALETAKAAASYPNVPAMVAHGLAAALYTASAIKAAAHGGGSGGGGGGGGGSGMSQARLSSQGREDGDGEPGKTSMVVNIYGHQINTSPEYEEVFYAGVERHRRQRWPGKNNKRGIGAGRW